jgi:signal transduction histidine kinase
MRPTSSLRSRLLIGTFLWTIGLIVVTNLVVLRLVSHALSGATVHLIAMSIVSAGLLAAGLVHIRNILAPFKQLQTHLTAVRDGREERIEGGYPSEFQPMVTDLNALLDHRAQLVRRAVAKAGDLAHGLKTPLAVLGHEAERLAESGHIEAAAIIGQQVERMLRQIDRHLARARVAASGPTPGVSASVLESSQGLARTLTRLHAEKGVEIHLSVSPSHCVRVHSEILDEMLGNLLDNACKWTKSEVSVQSLEEARGIAILVDDDGPGIPEELRERVLQRGVRADEAAPGSGFGLAIVADLAELYGGSITLEASPRGGVRARLVLPSSTQPPAA